MTIDWFTVGAQFVNFFILLWLLKYFLYGPITDAIDTREQRIEERFREADRKEEEARAEKESYEQKQAQLAERRESIIEEAREDAETRRERMLEEARSDVNSLRERWKQEVQREKEQFLKDLRKEASKAVQDQVKRVLKTLADEDLTRRMIETFLRRVKEIKDDEREQFLESVASSDEPVTVLSSHGLEDTYKDKLRESISSVLGESLPVEFEVDPDLVAGIEVAGAGRKIGWSVRDVLDRIERHVVTELEEGIVLEEPQTGPAVEGFSS